MKIMLQTDLANNSVIEIREIKKKLLVKANKTKSDVSKKIKMLIAELEKIDKDFF